MSGSDKHRPSRRRYPVFYERFIPIALAIVVLVIVVLLVIIVGVALGLFAGAR